MNTRVPRRATEAERALFYETLADVKPLKPQAKPPSPRPKKPPPKPVARGKPAKPPPRLDTEPPEIGGHRAVHMRKGRIEPEASLDLHGMNQERAHRALVKFLQRGRANDARVVLVITGKSGVLNRQLRLWLGHADVRPLVSGVSAAHRRHGGAGAYYVTLRKGRQLR